MHEKGLVDRLVIGEEFKHEEINKKKKFHNKKAEKYFKEKGYNLDDYKKSNGPIPIRKMDIIKWEKGSEKETGDRRL